jgi:single-stranded-DNA-specific exonuclease
VTRWLDPQPVEVPEALRRAVGGHPLVAETLVRRGVVTPEAARAFLDPAAYALSSPFDLPDVDRAVERLHQAIHGGQMLAVWGDLDADGQTATALLVERLGALGAALRFALPTRRQGRGLQPEGVQRLAAEGARLIVTCDTGTTAHAAAELAAGLGIDLIITDHHTPQEHLPPAFAVINPWRLPDGHPLRPLTGVGVAFALAQALDPGGTSRTLDLLALGTVADVGRLTGDNRALVQRGLEALRHTPRPGLQALYRRAGLRPEGLTEEHISFVLGPRLNALGRLADASTGVELLLTADPERAALLADEMEALNARRQWLTRQVMDGALAQIQQVPALVRDYAAVVLSDPGWLPGITGIVAGRLAERLGKPAVLIAAPPGEMARGSGRSVPGVNLIAALRECAPLLEEVGGHPGAAGFGLAPERIPALRAALSQAVAAQAVTAPERVLRLDAIVELPELNLELVAQIGRLAPFGRGNPPLILGIRDLRILSEAGLGPAGEHRRVTVEDDHDRTQTVFWWQGAGWPLPQGRFDLAVTLGSHDFQGMPEIQVQWIAARERGPEAVATLRKPPARPVAVRDYRTVESEEDALRVLQDEGNVQVWAEGPVPLGMEGRTRRELVPGGRLAIWTAPPAQRELQKVLDAVRPTELLLFGRDAGVDRAGPFLESLAGVAQFAQRARDGWVDLEAAAARLGHRMATVQAGLEWLAAGGQLSLEEKGVSRWLLAPGSGHADPQAMRSARRRLGDLLIETAAYRDYFRRAPADSLGP